LISDLTEKLREFIGKETDKLNDENATEAIEKVRQGQVDVDKLAEAWEKAYKQVLDSYYVRRHINRYLTGIM
jgi:hemoglobin-like flavoprotein